MALVFGEEKKPNPSPRTTRPPLIMAIPVWAVMNVKDEKTDRGEGHSQRGQFLGWKPVRKPARNRCEDGHDNGLRHEDQPRGLRVEPLDVLEVETQQKDHGKVRTVVDQGRQVGKGKGPVLKEPDIEHGALHPAIRTSRTPQIQ